jgi:hypothetical protein
VTGESRADTIYFDGEGRAYMQACLAHAFRWAFRHNIRAVVIFTGTGEGPLYAVQNLATEYPIGQVVAVTPPSGRAYLADPRDKESGVVRAGLAPPLRAFLQEMGVFVVSAHQPFKAVAGASGSPWANVDAALSILGGGAPLCVQAALVACDAGAVLTGERIVVATADTAISMVASRTDMFLSQTEGLLIEHVICRPRRYDISKREHTYLEQLWPSDETDPDLIAGIPLALPSKSEE